MRGNHLADQDLDARFDVENLAGRGNLGQDQLSLGAAASPNHGSPVRTEFEQHAGVLGREAETAVDTANLAIHVDQCEM